MDLPREALSTPSPEGERYRQLRFATRMRQLSASHQAVAWWRGKFQALVQPVGIALILALVAAPLAAGIVNAILQPNVQPDVLWDTQLYYERQRRAWMAAGTACGLVAVGLPSGAIWLGLRRRVRRLSEAEYRLAAKIDEVATEFPEEVRTWGGRANLREPEIVEQLVRELDAEQHSRSGQVTSSASGA